MSKKKKNKKEVPQWASDFVDSYERGRHFTEMLLEDIHGSMRYGDNDHTVRAHVVRGKGQNKNKIVYFGMDKDTMSDLRHVLKEGYHVETQTLQKPDVVDLHNFLSLEGHRYLELFEEPKRLEHKKRKKSSKD